MPIEITTTPTHLLAEYAGNAKLHTPEQVRQIAASIEAYGFNDPIGIWQNPDTGALEVVEGHGRLEAARQLELNTVPTIDLSHLTDSQRRQYALAHNQLNLSTGFNAEALQSELAELADSWDPAEFGFTSLSLSESEIDDLFQSISDSEAYDTNPPEPETVVCPNCGHKFDR